MKFPTILKELRELKDLDQQDLADYLHVSRSTIAGYETGRREPDYDKLLQIADFFEVSVDYLLTGKPRTEFIAFPSTAEAEAKLDLRVLTIYKKLGYDLKKHVLTFVQFLENQETE